MEPDYGLSSANAGQEMTATWYSTVMTALPNAARSFPSRFLVCVVLWVVAFTVRLDGMPSVLALQDAVGPFWSAIRMDGRAHADPYGALMVLPYGLAVWASEHLWGAFHWIACWHALAAPVVALSVYRIRPNCGLAIAAGLMVAFDPGLNDTFVSGAETYLAPLFLGLAACARGGWAWMAFCFAVANHPLAIAGAPLLLHRTNFKVHTLWAVVPGLVFVGIQMGGWGAPGVASDSFRMFDSIAAYFATGTLSALVIVSGPLMAMLVPSGWRVAVPVLVSFVLMLVAGQSVGYLRDHHFRMLTIPALACWAVLPGRAWLLMLPGCLAILAQERPPESGFRGSTLGLVSHLGRTVAGLAPPMVVDRIWLSGGPAVEPSALMLDLYLRGWGPITPGESMVVVFAAEDQERKGLVMPGTVLLDGHGYTVAQMKTDDVPSWSAQLCDASPTVGGAWDALSVLEPGRTTESVGLWWACR